MKSYLTLIVLVISFSGFALCETVLASQGAGHEHEHGGGGSFSLFSLVKPLGITALSCLLVTFLAGLFRRKLGRRFLKIHTMFAMLTVIIALLHGILVLILF